MSNTSDFSKPQTTDTYVNVTVEVNALANDLAQAMDPATTSPANTPTNAVRWNSANGFWEKFSGTTWNALAGVYNIVAAQANKLKTAVTLAIAGDISGSVSFDGSQSVSITATLPNVNGSPGTVGSSTVVPVITTNAKGQVTGVSSAGISFPSAPVTSVFGRTGAVALASSDVTGALGYTPPQPGGAGASGTWGINISGTAAVASRLNSTNGAGTYNWSGQGGQPSWLWGSNDGSNFYVWNPSNFSVNYANSAGSVAWGNVSGHPTDLGSFSNGPGYMNAVTLGNCYGDNTVPSSSLIATNVLPYRSGATLVFVRNTNCNCNCSC